MSTLPWPWPSVAAAWPRRRRCSVRCSTTRHSASESVASAETVQAWAGLHSLGGEEQSTYPITLSVDDLGEDFSLAVQALAEIGAQRVGDYMLAALGALVEALEQQPQTPLQHLEILPLAERQQVLHGFNATTRDYPRHSSLQALFELQVAVRARRRGCCPG